ncbi:MAG: hypothetical protein UW27_C0017G0113 [Parcubacteria group bacterium GW2011_GWA1_44_13]|uniref:Uncharacterized protein n=1 Tax=Candidatus Nomurabacteria bacterium GW2011_GWB1_44_12 TaxID=1618748 RepID=A0A837I7F7_9BACT|nr:MAG: hypothetical protein UW17_C0045G0002 [Candidatus Nomurabacteria bacterium GW2011_GWD1_44_10]KKT36728.1 MAG: hypothetical protein UW25_C0004G0056 [Candidatus Nomurabacteria bacterium GW2011_GWB1_44_12]KKT37496.1 MAG: hypothetical protein UW27_C0017G0113 [Parcubacteria group bacterium GW2011_GWA1_44_13]HBB44051.1 hypothetical protein [Candidatus Yonathbacteria bacterium]
MEAFYSMDEGSVTLLVHPSEAEATLVRMQLFLEEKQERGNSVPDFPENFFMKFSASKKMIPLVFGFRNADFAISFIEEFIHSTDSDYENAEDLKHFLYKYKVEYSISSTIQ